MLCQDRSKAAQAGCSMLIGAALLVCDWDPTGMQVITQAGLQPGTSTRLQVPGETLAACRQGVLYLLV